VVRETIHIDRCSSCGAVIALQPPMPDAKACAWLCETCGAIYFGNENAGAQCRGVVRWESTADNPFVAGVTATLDSVAPSIQPENVQRLVKSLAPSQHDGPNRRRYKRYTVTVPVVALPLASDFRIDGDPVQMTTANISLGGAALIHTRFIDAPYLALDFTVAGVELLQIVLKVLRVKSIGPIYQIGGQFVSRLSQVPI
jgi:PilZ domain